MVTEIKKRKINYSMMASLVTALALISLVSERKLIRETRGSYCDSSCVGEKMWRYPEDPIYRVDSSLQYNLRDDDRAYLTKILTPWNNPTCSADQHKYYNVPGLPRYENNDMSLSFLYKGDTNDNWGFRCEWDEAPYEPRLYVLTWETAAGKIAASTHFMIAHTGQGEDYDNLYTDEKLEELKVEYFAQFCSYIIASGDYNWTQPNVIDHIVSVFKPEEDDISFAIPQLDKMNFCGAVPECEQYSQQYELKMHSGFVIATEYNGSNNYKFSQTSLEMTFITAIITSGIRIFTVGLIEMPDHQRFEFFHVVCKLDDIDQAISDPEHLILQQGSDFDETISYDGALIWQSITECYLSRYKVYLIEPGSVNPSSYEVLFTSDGGTTWSRTHNNFIPGSPISIDPVMKTVNIVESNFSGQFSGDYKIVIEGCTDSGICGNRIEKKFTISFTIQNCGITLVDDSAVEMVNNLDNDNLVIDVSLTNFPLSIEYNPESITVEGTEQICGPLQLRIHPSLATLTTDYVQFSTISTSQIQISSQPVEMPEYERASTIRMSFKQQDRHDEVWYQFNLIELDCSIRFEGDPYTNPQNKVVYLINTHDASDPVASVAIASNPLTPTKCSDSGKLEVFVQKYGYESIFHSLDSLSWIEISTDDNKRDIVIKDIDEVNRSDVEGKHLVTVRQKEDWGSSGESEKVIDLYMCWITMPDPVLKNNLDDPNEPVDVGYFIDKSDTNTDSLTIELNSFSMTSECGDIIYEGSTSSASMQGFNAFTNGQATFDGTKVHLNDFQSYPLGVLTVRIKAWPNDVTDSGSAVEVTFTVNVRDCLSETVANNDILSRNEPYISQFGDSGSFRKWSFVEEYTFNDPQNQCQVWQFRFSCTDPSQGIYEVQEGLILQNTSQKCKKFIVETLASNDRSLEIIESEYSDDFASQAEVEGEYLIKFEPIHKSNSTWTDASVNFKIHIKVNCNHVTIGSPSEKAKFTIVPPPTTNLTASFQSEDIWYWQGSNISFYLESFVNPVEFSCDMTIELYEYHSQQQQYASKLVTELVSLQQEPLELKFVQQAHEKFYSDGPKHLVVKAQLDGSASIAIQEITLLIFNDCANSQQSYQKSVLQSSVLTDTSQNLPEVVYIINKETHQELEFQHAILKQAFVSNENVTSELVTTVYDICPFKQVLRSNLENPTSEYSEPEEILFLTTEDENVKIKINPESDTNIKTYNQDGEIDCDLSLATTKSCFVNFHVEVYTTANGTIVDDILAQGTIIFKSECYLIDENWSIIEAEENSIEYKVGNKTAQTLDLPYLNTNLTSSENIVTRCGQISLMLQINTTYASTVEQSIGANNVPSLNDQFLLTDFVLEQQEVLESGAPQAKLKVLTDNQTYALYDSINIEQPLEPYQTSYKITIRVQFAEYEDFPTQVESKSYQMNLVITDWCAQDNYAGPPGMIDQTLNFDFTDSSDQTPGTEAEPWVYNVTKYLKTEMDSFYIEYTDYQKYGEDEKNSGCSLNPDRPNNYTIIEQSYSPDIPGILYQPIAREYGQNGVLFNLEAISRDQIGNHYIIVEIESSLPRLKGHPISTSPKRYIKIYIEIMDCKLLQFTPGTQQFVSKRLNIGEEIVFPFKNYTMNPDCQFNVDYTLTLLKKQTEFSEVQYLTPQNEGTNTSPEFITLSGDSLTILPLVGNQIIGKTYQVWINGHVNVNSTIQGPVSATNEEFDISVNFPDVFKNTAPKMHKLNKLVLIVPNVTDVYKIGTPYDLEQDLFYVEEWGFVDVILADEQPTWIKFVNKTISEGIKFEMSPAVEDAKAEYQIYFILKDVHPGQADESQKFEFKIRVKEPEKVITYVKKQETIVFETVEKEPVLVTFEPPDSDAKFKVNLDKYIRLPSNFSDWSNYNEGAEKIKISYEPTEDTLNFMYDQDLVVELRWSILEVQYKEDQPEDLSNKEGAVARRRLQEQQQQSNDDNVKEVIPSNFTLIEANQFSVQLNFTESQLVSKTSKDKITIEILASLLQYEERYTIANLTNEDDVLEVSQSFKIQKIQSSALIEMVESLSADVENYMQAFFSANIVFSIFSSGFLQFLWGLINTMQIIVLTDLFSVDVPVNADIIMRMILKLCSFDFVKTEEIYKVFKFRETEAFQTKVSSSGEEYSKFADAGYDSANFFLLLGPILLFIPLFLLYAILMRIIRFLLKKCPTCNNCITRRFQTQIQFLLVITRFLLEGCLEIGLSAMITVIMMNKQNFETFWESVSTTFSFLFLACLAITPIVFFYITRSYLKNKKEAQDDQPAQEVQFQELFEQYKTNKMALRYSSIFFMRRYILLIVLTIMPGNALVQIVTHIFSTIYVIAYIWSVQPYEDPSTNKQELINELIVFVAAYPLFLFTPYVADEEARIKIGWFIVGCILLNIMFNIIYLCCHAFMHVYLKIKYCCIRSAKRKKFIAEQKYRIEEANKLREQKKVQKIEKEKKEADREIFIMSLFKKPLDYYSDASNGDIESNSKNNILVRVKGEGTVQQNLNQQNYQKSNLVDVKIEPNRSRNNKLIHTTNDSHQKNQQQYQPTEEQKKKGLNAFNCPNDSNSDRYFYAENYEYEDDFIEKAAAVEKPNSLSISNNSLYAVPYQQDNNLESQQNQGKDIDDLFGKQPVKQQQFTNQELEETIKKVINKKVTNTQPPKKKKYKPKKGKYAKK